MIFTPPADGSRRDLSAASLKLLAGELELDQEDFDVCLDSGKFKELVQNQTRAFQGIGVSSTPSFIVNGTPIVGAQPFENFQLIIETELNK